MEGRLYLGPLEPGNGSHDFGTQTGTDRTGPGVPEAPPTSIGQT